MWGRAVFLCRQAAQTVATSLLFDETLPADKQPAAHEAAAQMCRCVAALLSSSLSSHHPLFTLHSFIPNDLRNNLPCHLLHPSHQKIIKIQTTSYINTTCQVGP